MSVNTSILFTAPGGVPGDISDRTNTVVESGIMDDTLIPAAYGLPIKLTAAGKVAKIEAGDTAADVYGILVRSAPTSATALNQPFGSVPPNALQPVNIAVGGPGRVIVICAVGTPVKGKAVYMRVVADTGKEIGDLEADADGVNNVLLPFAVWGANGVNEGNVTSLRITTPQ